MGFVTILAKIRDVAGGAGWIARLTDVTSMQDQPMMRVVAKLERYRLQELVLHGPHRLAGRQARAIGDSEYMGVHCDGGLAKGRVQDDIGGFSAHPRQSLQFLARPRYGASVVFGQKPAGCNDVLRLAVVEADRPDVRRQALNAQRE